MARRRKNRPRGNPNEVDKFASRVLSSNALVAKAIVTFDADAATVTEATWRADQAVNLLLTTELESGRALPQVGDMVTLYVHGVRAVSVNDGDAYLPALYVHEGPRPVGQTHCSRALDPNYSLAPPSPCACLPADGCTGKQP